MTLGLSSTKITHSHEVICWFVWEFDVMLSSSPSSLPLSGVKLSMNDPFTTCLILSFSNALMWALTLRLRSGAVTTHTYNKTVYYYVDGQKMSGGRFISSSPELSLLISMPVNFGWSYATIFCDY